MNLKDKLLIITRKECKENKITLYLGKGKTVSYTKGIKSSGFFDFDHEDPFDRKLACATKLPNWELTLVHELSHMRQWKENCKVWQDFVNMSNNNIDSAVLGKEVSLKHLLKDINITIKMEHDCEKRAYTTLKELGYPKHKLEEYVQKANAYVLFYLHIAKTKSWYKSGKAPYSIKNVWSKFPKTFDFDVHATYNKLQHLYNECY